MNRGMEHICYKERLREFEFFNLENRRIKGDLIVSFQYLKGTYKKGGEGLLNKGMQ